MTHRQLLGHLLGGILVSKMPTEILLLAKFALLMRAYQLGDVLETIKHNIFLSTPSNSSAKQTETKLVLAHELNQNNQINTSVSRYISYQGEAEYFTPDS